MDGKHKWSRFLCSVELRHSIVYTQPHGRAFKVLVPKTFEREICPVYFGHSRYSTFLRDLNRYSFKHLTKGDDRNSKCFCGVHHFTTNVGFLMMRAPISKRTTTNLCSEVVFTCVISCPGQKMHDDWMRILTMNQIFIM